MNNLKFQLFLTDFPGHVHERRDNALFVNECVSDLSNESVSFLKLKFIHYLSKFSLNQ